MGRCWAANWILAGGEKDVGKWLPGWGVPRVGPKGSTWWLWWGSKLVQIGRMGIALEWNVGQDARDRAFIWGARGCGKGYRIEWMMGHDAHVH